MVEKNTRPTQPTVSLNKNRVRLISPIPFGMRHGFDGTLDEVIDFGGDCNASGGDDPRADTDVEFPAIQ